MRASSPCLPVQVKCDGIVEAISVMQLQEEIANLEGQNLLATEIADGIAQSRWLDGVLPGRARFWGVVNGRDKSAIIYMTRWGRITSERWR